MDCALASTAFVVFFFLALFRHDERFRKSSLCKICFLIVLAIASKLLMGLGL